MKLNAVILAAGMGKRLRPLTLTRTKAMAPIAGVTIVERVLETLPKDLLASYTFVINPADREIVEKIKHTIPDAHFVIQHEARGAAHALQQALEYCGTACLVTACDSIVPAHHVRELVECHAKNSAAVSLSFLKVAPEESLTSRSVVELHEGRVTRIIEKPTVDERLSDITTTPLYIFGKEYLELLPHTPLSPRGEYELQYGIQIMIERGLLVQGAFTPSRIDVTTLEDLRVVNMHYFENDPALARNQSHQVSPTATLIPPYVIEEGVVIEPGATIGPNVLIERGAVIKKEVTIENSLVLRAVTVATGTQSTGDVFS